jgi:NAD(P)-dependent dehydrogenase (short-subunit alcohol dehydrogenase family)
MQMQGRRVAITGPTAGIGRSTALELARRGASLTLFCRNRDKALGLQQDIVAAGGEPPAVILMDMARLDSVRQAAAEFLEADRPLDVLLNNAGVINTRRRESADGFEETLAVNHFAPFLLTGLLLPTLLRSEGARIVNVASNAHAFVRDMGWEDMQAERSYKTFREYGRSKLANILFTRSLAQRLENRDITVNSLHPGAVATSLGNNNGWLGKALPAVLKPFFRSPEKGAETSIYLAGSDDVSRVSGAYFVDCRARDPKPWARDDAAARRLWQYTEETVGFRYPSFED